MLLEVQVALLRINEAVDASGGAGGLIENNEAVNASGGAGGLSENPSTFRK